MLSIYYRVLIGPFQKQQLLPSKETIVTIVVIAGYILLWCNDKIYQHLQCSRNTNSKVCFVVIATMFCRWPEKSNLQFQEPEHSIEDIRYYITFQLVRKMIEIITLAVPSRWFCKQLFEYLVILFLWSIQVGVNKDFNLY